ncbi:hypothetical protein P22_3288 [Propionispora sp. 2/2-37]|nr:hypothetical protein P22_3288 [Propionispora sp. 2/2-37]
MHGPGPAVSSGRHMRMNATEKASHGLESAKIKNKFDKKSILKENEVYFE